MLLEAELPDFSKAPNLRQVYLRHCGMSSHVGLQPNQNTVALNSITSLGTKFTKYHVFTSLLDFTLDFSGLTELPDNFGLCFPSLERLDLRRTKVRTMPASIKHLSKLFTLTLSNCSRLRHILELPPSINWFTANDCRSLRYMPEVPPSIRYFTAGDCKSLKTLQFTLYSMPLSCKHFSQDIELYNCVKLDDHKLVAVARHYKLTIQRIISANIKDAHAALYIKRSKVPEFFSNFKASQDLVSVTLRLPLHSKAMGFIFYFILFPQKMLNPVFQIKFHVELSNIPKVQFTYHSDYWSSSPRTHKGHVLFCYENSLSFQIIEELSRIKTSATTNDLDAKISFEGIQLLDHNYNIIAVKEWGVYCIF